MEEGGGVPDGVSVESIRSLVSEAAGLKDKGNADFVKGRALAKHTAGKDLLADACVHYATGLQALTRADDCMGRLPSPLADLSPGLACAVDEVRVALFLNLAACNLLLQEWDPALACCTQVLEHCGGEDIASPSTVPSGGPEGPGARSTASLVGGGRNCSAAKALFRRGKAYVGKGELEKAKEDLQQALVIQPKDSSIKAELQGVNKAIAAAEARQNLRRETEAGRERARRRQEEAVRPPSPPDEVATAEAPSLTAPVATEPEALIGGGSPTPATGQGVRLDGPTAGGGKVAETPGLLGGGAATAGAAAAATAATELERAGPPPAALAECPSEQGMPAAEEGEGEGAGEGGEEGPDGFLTTNGGEARGGLYKWSQTIPEVQVSVCVPKHVSVKDMAVEFRRLHLRVAYRDAQGAGTIEGGPARASAAEARPQREVHVTELLAGPLSRPIRPGECLWTMEAPGRLQLYLQKELPLEEGGSDGGKDKGGEEREDGPEWWACVLEGDPQIDTRACFVLEDLSDLPEHARRRAARALREEEDKPPDQREKERAEKERLLAARRQLEEEVLERQREHEKAMKDPKKGELYRKLKEMCPDIPISIK